MHEEKKRKKKKKIADESPVNRTKINQKKSDDKNENENRTTIIIVAQLNKMLKEENLELERNFYCSDGSTADVDSKQFFLRGKEAAQGQT